MLFGNDKHVDKIDSEKLIEFLDSCLNQKLQLLDSRGRKIKERIIESVSSFGKAIEEFQELEQKPDKEYLLPISDALLSSQKSKYSKAVLHLISEFPKEYEGRNLYYINKNLFDKSEELINNVLKTNNIFKVVINGYSNNLSEIKRDFSAIERAHKELKEALENSIQEFDEYIKISSKINEFAAHISELDFLKRVDNENTGFEPESQSNEAGEISNLIYTKGIELESEQKQLLKTESMIKEPLFIIERAARKYDHVSSHKRKLVDFILDPTKAIKTETDYNELKKQLLELKKELELHKIEIKNNDEVSHFLDSFEDWNLYGLIESLKAPSNRIEKIKFELMSLNNKLDHINRRNMLQKEKIESIEETKAKFKRVSALISNQKLEIEQLFLKHYKKKVEIMMS